MVCLFVHTYSNISFDPFISQQVNSLPADKLQEIQKAIELISVGQGPAKTMEEASRRSYQFWDTQPVPKLGVTFDWLFAPHPQETVCPEFMWETVLLYFRGDGDVTWLDWTWQRQHSGGALQPPTGLQLGHPWPGKCCCGKTVNKNTNSRHVHEILSWGLFVGLPLFCDFYFCVFLEM